MPPFYDQWSLRNAIQNRAIPALERLAENPHLRERSLRRFDRDDPPRYKSSSEDEEDDEEYAVYMYDCARMVGLDSGAMLDELNHTIETPLSSFEQSQLAYSLNGEYRTYNAGTRYQKEAEIEEDRLECYAWLSSDEAKNYLLTNPFRAGQERTNVIVRRNIKRQWQKLGVWNPDWGIPGRRSNPQANDDPAKWKWAWEHDGSTELTPQHPIKRAIHLRRDLRRGEHKPVVLHSSLHEDSSASQAEAFIISRPWFLYDMDQAEERVRLGRLSARKKHWYETPKEYVNEQWKLRGDQREGWKSVSGYFRPGWKWGHESPCPEPEDLTPLNTMDMEFTPSEVDALEAIPPPLPEPDSNLLPPGHPYLREPNILVRGSFGASTANLNLSEEPPESSESERSPESEQSTESEQSPEPEQHPLPNRRGRQDRDEIQAPPRRSARIAAMKANQSALPLKSSASSPLDKRSRNKPRRGRPRKVDSPVMSEMSVRSRRGGKRK